MGANDFIYVFTEQQITHLGSRINTINLLRCQSIPESYGPIRSSSSRGQ